MERLQKSFVSDIIYKNAVLRTAGKEAFALFHAADFLLPRDAYLPDWPVIACDQFTSDRSYWDRVRHNTEQKISSYHLILPEIDLCTGRDVIGQIHNTMERYLREKIFAEYPDCYIYVERMMSNGLVRCGILGIMDLAQYDYGSSSSSPIRATEATVLERLPARKQIRQEAALELSHAILFCDDDRYRLIESVSRRKDTLPNLYELSLMEGGGTVSGWLLQGPAKQDFERNFEKYVLDKKSQKEIILAVADGNHSIAAAKACYETSGVPHGPKRYAMAEMVNLRDPAIRFYPIHRLVSAADAPALLSELERICTPGGYPVPWIMGTQRGVLEVDVSQGDMALSILQDIWDSWLDTHPGTMDYIHGDGELVRLASQSGCIGFLLPALEKQALFPLIEKRGPLPRKTFSLGNAREKRYYLEGRKLI